MRAHDRAQVFWACGDRGAGVLGIRGTGRAARLWGRARGAHPIGEHGARPGSGARGAVGARAAWVMGAGERARRAAGAQGARGRAALARGRRARAGGQGAGRALGGCWGAESAHAELLGRGARGGRARAGGWCAGRALAG
ncbi:PREDICTED: glycine-rich cell wall structural protein 1.8-like [Erythranthe guttata]|uniref:glycine-rich cell wall structural protein 1.8-like n=1 Tax=Erythranthe guttata TaxID=4155 RepID=UPI00064D7EFF|nr:PREDICTED: glycine-rich cell wall structural protein 1.8-like [Erythranthe guttata]|eukprot:XP_012845760.1 PREDICTED: glycine-rich cell wall structural protein 1.8-like [Erythranthe guttata]